MNNFVAPQTPAGCVCVFANTRGVQANKLTHTPRIDSQWCGYGASFGAVYTSICPVRKGLEMRNIGLKKYKLEMSCITI